MSSSDRLPGVLTEWTGVLMHASSNDFSRIMRDYSLSMPQLSTLMRLYYRRAGAVSDIAVALGVTNAAASQMVDRLVQLGLIDRLEDKLDRRVKHVELTEKGRALIQRTMDVRRRWMEDLTTRLTPEQQEAIVTALTLLTEAARHLEQPEPEISHRAT
jgi:DNA-binding MarR family transcriptional regulator